MPIRHCTPSGGTHARNFQINVNGKLYRTANRGGWLRELSLFCWLSLYYPHKAIKHSDIKHIAKKNDLTESSIRRKLTTLADNGLILKPNEINDHYILKSNKQIWEAFGGNYEVKCYIPYDTCRKGLQAIYDHLRLIPLISELERQLRLIALKENLISIKDTKDIAGVRITANDLKRLRKAERTDLLKNANLILTISNEKVAEILNVSIPTAIYLKRILGNTRGYKVERRYKLLMERVSHEEYISLRAGGWELVGLPEYFLWNWQSGAIYCDTSSQFYLPKRASRKNGVLHNSESYLSGGRQLDYYRTFEHFHSLSAINNYHRIVA